MNQFDGYLDALNLKNECKEMIENFEIYVEAYKMAAKYEKAYYDELVKEGFSEQQALEIIKHQGAFGALGPGGSENR